MRLARVPVMVPCGATLEQAVLERLPIAAIVLNSEGEVMWSNDKGARLIPALFSSPSSPCRCPRELPCQFDLNFEGEFFRIEADRFDHAECSNGTLLLISPWREIRAKVISSCLARERIAETTQDAAVSDVYGRIAHDVNNVLGIIKGYTQALIERLEKSEEIPPQFGAALLKGSQRLEQVSAKVQAMGTKIAVKRETVDLNELIKRTIGEWLQPFSALFDIRIEMQLAEALPPIVADPNRLTLLLLFLIDRGVRGARNLANGKSAQISLGTSVKENHVILEYRDGCSRSQHEDLAALASIPLIQAILMLHDGKLSAEVLPPEGVGIFTVFPQAKG